MHFLRCLSKLSLLVFVFALTACSAKQETSRVKMTFPDWNDVYQSGINQHSSVSTLSVPDQSKIKLVAVNITGADMAPVLFEWRRKDDDNSLAPTSIDIPNVSRGASRLVQVLALYEGGSSSQFFYGDSTVEVNAAVVTADVFVTLANSTTIDSNTIGRYLNADGTGPTGKFQYRFVPQGRPSMVVTTGEIFAGWMDIYSLQSPILKHTKFDGTPLFDVSSAAALFQPGVQTRAARLHMPAGFEDRGNEMEEGTEKQLNIGFFGAGSAAKRLCLNSSRSTVNGYYATAAKANPFVWSGHLAPITGSELFTITVQDPDAAASTFEKGGDVASTCSMTGVEFVDFLKLDETRLGNSDNFLQFRAPFGRIPGNAAPENGGMITKQFFSGSQQVSVKVSPLPGVAEALGGFKLFYRSRATAQEANDDDESIRGNDGYRCSEFSSMGFSTVDMINNSGSSSYPYVHEAIISSVSSEAAAEKLQIIVCPYAKASDGGAFFEAGLRYHGSYSGGGSGPSMAPATKLMVKSLEGAGYSEDSRRAVGNGFCYAADVVATDASGMPGYLPSPISIAITKSDTLYTYVYSDPTCTNQISTLSGFNGQQRVYFKDVQSVDRNYEFTFTPASALAAGTFYANRVDTSGATDMHMIFKGDLYAHSCTSVEFIAQENSQGALKAFSGGTVTLNSVSGNMTYYNASDWNCTTALPLTLTLPVNVASVGLRVKYVGTESNANIYPTPAAAGFSGTIVPPTVKVQQPGAPARLQISAAQQMSSDVCSPFFVSLVDANGRTTPNTTGSTVTFSMSTSSAGAFKNGCATNASSGSIFASQTSTSSLSYLPTAVGTHSLSVAVTSGQSLSPSSPVTTNVVQSVANRVVLVMPGETWNGTSVIGSPTNAVTNTSYTITVYALRPNNSIDTNFNLSETAFGLGSGWGPGFYVSSPVVWTAGVGTMDVNIFGVGNLNFSTGGMNNLMFMNSSSISVGP